MPHARIFQQPKNAMQSGRGRTASWLLEYLPSEARRADPLTGWAGSGDTERQLRLEFPTQEAALAYAAAQGIDAVVIATPPRVLKLQTYADNFR
jgi:hypothetical protein